MHSQPRKASKAYKAEAPDFIIVDLMMESVDAGKNFVKELKLLNNTAPIYMLSSVGDSLATNINFAELGLTGVFQEADRFQTRY